MTPEHVTEGQENTGLQPAGQAGDANGLALNDGEGSDGSLDLTVGNWDGQEEEPSLSEEVAGKILQATPDVFSKTVAQLDESHDEAMRMHRYYNDVAVNGTEISLNSNPSENAKDYMTLAITASGHKVSLLKGILGMMNKARKPSKPANGPQNPVQIKGDNTQVVQVFGSHREMLGHIDKITGKADGKKPAHEVSGNG